jgi:hypothetical protein
VDVAFVSHSGDKVYGGHPLKLSFEKNPGKPDRLILHLAVTLFAFFLTVLCATAQTTTGSFVGRISDPDGNVVSNATVALRNEATGITATQQCSSTGDYTFSYVQPGVYELRVTAKGFQSQVISHLNLDIQQTLREDFTLRVGEATTSVQVTAQTPLIQTDSTYVGNIVDSKQIEQTPLNGRENAYSLLGLAPGVQRPNSNALISGGSFKGGANQTIDGISNDDVVQARMSDQVPSMEDMAEFNTIGINAPAEYGNGGAQVVIVTKSGTNSFHGSAFEFNRNRYFQARNWALQPSQPIPPFNRNEYGFSFGGPLLHDRLFFFTSFENIHGLTTATRTYSMPPTPWLTGDFSQFTSVPLANGTKQATIVYDPENGQPFPNNQIPGGRINQTVQNFLRFYSTPNTPSLDGIASNFTYSSPTLEIDPRFSIRIDYQATSKDHLMFRFYNNLRNPAPFDEAGTDKFGNYSKLGNVINQFAGNYTRVLSNSMVNELVLGLNKRADPRIDQNHTIDPSSLVAGLPPVDPGFGLLPTVNISNLQKIFSTGSSFQHQHTVQVNDNLSITKGSHNIKVGGQFLAEAESGTSYNTGSFSFSGQYSGRYHVPGSTQTTNAVNGFADFLLGDLDSSSTANADFRYYVTAKTYALYARDSWNATSKLTVEMGLRYDKLFPFQMSRGGLATFSPDLKALVVIRGTPSTDIANAYPIVMGSTVGYNMSNWLHLQNTNFAPRLGIAYRPWDAHQFVVRAGFGIFYDNLSIQDLVNNLGNQLPFVLSTSYTNPSTTTPSLSFDNPFPSGGKIPANPNASGVGRDLKTPSNTQWNLSVEGATWKQVALRAAYIGNLGTHLHTPFPLNQVTPQPIGAGTPFPNTQAAVPFQPFAGITYYIYGESTNVNQLQLAARRRFAGLTFDAEYQFTRALGIDGPNEESVTDRRNIRYDYGNLDFYARHELALNYSYHLPFGTGQLLLGNAGPWVNRIIGGWQLAGVWKAASGTPFSVSFNSSVAGLPGGRADLVPGVRLYPSKKTTKEWFNSQAFSSAFANPATPQYRYGNSQRNMMYGPDFSEWDCGVLKDFKITERVSFQFRAEAFDVLNRSNFGNPAANISVANVATITSTSADNRELQFGGRISF